MEEVRLSPLRQSSLKSSLSGRTTPRGSPSFRRAHSCRTPRREVKSGGGPAHCFRSSRLVYWLLLITLWTYLGFYVQSRWAHDNREELQGFEVKARTRISELEQRKQRNLIASENSTDSLGKNNIKETVGAKRIKVALAKKIFFESTRSANSKKKSRKSAGVLRRRTHSKRKTKSGINSNEIDGQDQELPRTNATFGRLFGPFATLEDQILEWSPEKRSGTCDRKSNFARLVWSRRFILIFHELSMTGAPISMMELATELLSCGATVSAVVLSRKGGLMPELTRRRVKVIEDKADASFKASMKADLIIAGSAVCANWIDQYLDHFPAGGSQIAWWIMENRREYFNRAKPVLKEVKMLIFLSEMQSKQWLSWCQEDDIKLRSQPVLVPLSINDELAFVAGLSSSLNTPTFSTQRMLEKKNLLRESVRKLMGLTQKDMLVISLSSINPGKGQLLLLESAALTFELESSHTDSKKKNSKIIKTNQASLAARHHLRGLLLLSNSTASMSPKAQGRLLSDNGTEELSLKILIGSVGSKSNKVPYIKEILSYISNNGNLSRSMLWTPATSRVASLYSAADVYVINSQGVGETFGRVTIEAMAYGLPVLGTDAGGTKEIVDHNVTGLLHPVGHQGNRVLADNLRFLLKNPSARAQMGEEGRRKVERLYLKKHMYKRFVEVLYKCMRPK